MQRQYTVRLPLSIILHLSFPFPFSTVHISSPPRHSTLFPSLWIHYTVLFLSSTEHIFFPSLYTAHYSSPFALPRPRGLTFTWWGCCGLCFWHKPTELAHPFFFCFVSVSYGPFNCISFHEFSQQLSAFSVCSSGLISVLLVLSTLYLFTKVSFSPDIILYGRLGLKLVS